jgi:hypothetical protein
VRKQQENEAPRTGEEAVDDVTFKVIGTAGIVLLGLGTLVLTRVALNLVFDGRAKLRGVVRYVTRIMVTLVIIALIIWLGEITKGWN